MLLVTKLSKRGRSAGAGALIAALVIVVAGCGFSDDLTRRGFVEEGDQICGETILKTAFAIEAEGGLAAGVGTSLGALGGAYGDAARRFERLEVDEEDEAMQERIVGGFRMSSKDLQQIATNAAAGADIQEQAARTFVETGALLDQIEAYGFEICGGRISQLQQ